MSELNAREAVYGFIAYLTTREKMTILSRYEDCSQIADTLAIWADKNNLPPVTEEFPHNLKVLRDVAD